MSLLVNTWSLLRNTVLLSFLLSTGEGKVQTVNLELLSLLTACRPLRSFYGASLPTPDLSMGSLSVLSSHQAVGDVAVFLNEYVKVSCRVQC
jgi:hypothetical protein